MRPGNIAGIDELRLASKYTVDIGVASREDILVELERIARRATMETQYALDDVEVVEDEDDLEADDGVSDAPLVRLVNSIVMQAATDGASDIRFDQQEDSLLVRVRVDGVLSETQRIPKRMANGVTTRLKVLAKLDIAERRKPQDGRIALNARAVGRMLDIRVAVLPTVEGEQVVMRASTSRARRRRSSHSACPSRCARRWRRSPSAGRRPGRCWSPGQPLATESRRRSMRPSPRSTGPRSTSSRSRILSNQGPDRHLPLSLMNNELQEALVATRGPRRRGIDRAAAGAGMRSLWDDGAVAKAAAGLTSLGGDRRIVSDG